MLFLCSCFCGLGSCYSSSDCHPSSVKSHHAMVIYWDLFLFLCTLLSYTLTTIMSMINYLLNCSDFLTRSYDIGGVVSVMALSSLYMLMTQHGLEYPNFYEKLYALLEPSIFMAKYRAKFFQVLLCVSGFNIFWRVRFKICFVF